MEHMLDMCVNGRVLILGTFVGLSLVVDAEPRLGDSRSLWRGYVIKSLSLEY